MAASYGPPLPPEIYREILARMPVKSILRCRSVCKSCYSLISCSDFISHHTITNLHNKRGNHIVLQLRDLNAGSTFISRDIDMEFGDHNDDYSPVTGRLIGKEIAIVGSCNGLICLSAYDEYDDLEEVVSVDFLIWNPAIRKIVDLPSINYNYHTQQLSYVGFGFDPNTSDYKVMCYVTDNDSLDEKIDKNVCEIFYLSKGAWRRISTLMPSPRFYLTNGPEAECYVNGAVHWSVCRSLKGSRRVVLSFNMNNESFREIRMPDCAELMDDALKEIRCVAFDGLVHAIAWKNTHHGPVDVSHSCSVWTMKEYGVTESWIKMYSIDLQSAQVMPSTRFYPRYFILWGKREIIMLHHNLVESDGKDFRLDLVLYNIGSRKSNRIFSVTKVVENLCQYKESLVLM